MDEVNAAIDARLSKLLKDLTDNKRIDPVDPSVPTSSNAGDTFDAIMNDYLSTEFGDAETAAAYLQQRVSDAGIEVRITSNGYEVESAEPDPGNVAARLRGQGVTDRALIQQAVHEANVAIVALEAFVQDAQATIPVGRQAGGVARSVPQQPGDPWAVLVPEWIPFVPDGFDLHLPSDTAGVPTDAAGGPTDAADVFTEITPRVLMSMERTTASGLNIEARIATGVVNVVDSGLGSGYHVAPFVSVFEKWTLRA